MNKKKAPHSGRVWVGFDLGGTKMLAKIFNDDYETLGRAKQKTLGAKGAKTGLNRMASLIGKALDAAGVSPDQIAGIGVGCPGPIDAEKGAIVEALQQFPLIRSFAIERQPPDSILVRISEREPIAAIAGDQVGYAIGRKGGPSVFNRPDSRFFRQEYVEKAEHFFAEHGPRTIIIVQRVVINGGKSSLATTTPLIKPNSMPIPTVTAIATPMGKPIWRIR